MNRSVLDVATHVDGVISRLDSSDADLARQQSALVTAQKVLGIAAVYGLDF